MNGVGIDHQRGHTMVVVREDGHLVSVGDGRCWAIPSREDGEGRWGSAAIAGGSASESDAGRCFWSGLRGALSGHIGGLVPSRAHGFRLTIAVPDPDLAEAARLARVLTEADLPNAEIVAATDALLAAWLAFGPTESRSNVVAAVVVGDDGYWVRAYAPDGGSRPRMIGGEVISTPSNGHSAFSARLLGLLSDRLPDPPDTAARPALANGVLAYAETFRVLGSTADAGVTWRGPYAANLFVPLRLTAAEIAAWPEARALRARLPITVKEACRPFLSSGKAPGAIVLGGIGSVWPFVTQALSGGDSYVWPTGTGSLQNGGDPCRLVAAGAALWGVEKSLEIGGALMAAARAPHALSAGEIVVLSGEKSNLPPWRQRARDPFSTSDPE